MIALSWLALARDLEELPEPRHTRTDSASITTLRERIDRSRAIALLIGPLLGRLSALPDFDYRECALAAVDGFLHVQRAQSRASAASIESAGA